MKKSKTVSEYISHAPKPARAKLKTLRSLIKKTAPNAKEVISYGIPTFKLKGNLVHFGAFTNHISFFPTSSGVRAFKKELANYITGKGTIQFPLDKPIPFNLIKKVVKFRVKESLNKK